MQKKIAIFTVLLLALLYLVSISQAGLHFGIIDAIKQRGEELKDKVEDKRKSEDFTIGPPIALEKISWVGSVYGTVLADGRIHKGIDIVADEGTAFIAVCPGTIVMLDERPMPMFNSKLQINVNLKYNNEYTVHYAFEPVKQITVSLFERVEKGRIIGYLGNSWDGRHVCFAVIRNGDWVCPTPYLVEDVRKKLNESYHGANPPNICNCPEHQFYFR